LRLAPPPGWRWVTLIAAGIACQRAAPPEAGGEAVDRSAWNRAAVELDEPVFWTSPPVGPRGLLPDHMAILARPGFDASTWISEDGYQARYAAIRRHLAHPPNERRLSPDERERRRLLRSELAHGEPTLIETDLRALNPGEREMIRSLIDAGAAVERLFALQRGVADLEQRIPRGDTLSRALFRRNQGPACVWGPTAEDPRCTAIPGLGPVAAGVYPYDAPIDVCARLERMPNADALFDPFVAVHGSTEAPEAVPYSHAWPDEMRDVADALDAASRGLGPREAAFQAYLRAAAAAFRNDDWFAADAAWAATARQSRFFLRVAPDETYWDACDRKAGFHMVLGLVDGAAEQDAQSWRPLIPGMEAEIARLAGPAYAAREVEVDLPEFVGVVFNAGEARRPLGGTLGQSLPNWGPVAEAGGRTIVMTNIGSDPDSVRRTRAQAEAVFCAEPLAGWSADPVSLRRSTVLHELAHNLGPGVPVGGRSEEMDLGGPLAGLYGELGAQTAAGVLAPWLAVQGRLSPEQVRDMHVSDLVWCMGKIAGDRTDGAELDAYGQLCAMQLGWLAESGVARFDPSRVAANGQDEGCLDVDVDRLTPAWQTLGAEVFGLRARRDREAAASLRTRLVDAPGSRDVRQILADRWRRFPEPSYVYALRLDGAP
jgi:hypothetical protein